MLDFKTQSQIVDATASVMRWYVTAAINTSAASTCRGLSLWSELLDATAPRNASARQNRGAEIGVSISPSHAEGMETPLGRMAQWPWPTDSIPSTSPLARAWWLGSHPAMWSPLAGWTAWSRASLPAWNGWLTPATTSSAARAVPNGAAERADDSGYASYRSAGGHASAQVIMGTAPNQTNGRASPPKRS